MARCCFRIFSQPRRGIKHIMVVATTAPRNNNNEPKSSLSIAVLGAGAAGLVSARQLLREGHNVTIFEQAPAVGGTWIYSDEIDSDDDNNRQKLVENGGTNINIKKKVVHGSMYASLRTNLPRQTMAFSDFPFDDNFPGSFDSRQFPCHQEVLRYLEAFAQQYGLYRYIRFNTKVESVRPLGRTTDTTTSSTGQQLDNDVIAAQQQQSLSNGVEKSWPPSWYRWKVTTSSIKATTTNSSNTDNANSSMNATAMLEEHEFDAVLVCNGHYTESHIPCFPGQAEFSGHQVHSHNYRTADGYEGQTVVLIGASSSGTDIAEELAQTGAKRVFLSARTWQNPLTGETLANPQLVDATNDDRNEIGTHRVAVQKVGNVVKLGPGKKVTFDHGIEIDDVDTVMYCTGYRYRFPFFEEEDENNESNYHHHNIATNGTQQNKQQQKSTSPYASLPPIIDDNQVQGLYKHIFLPHYAPTLAFIGLCWKVLPFIQFELQSTFVARFLARSANLMPIETEMMEDAEQFYMQLEEEGVPKRYTHRQAGDVQWSYDDWLTWAAGPGAPKLPKWRIDLYNATGKHRIAMGIDKYRDVPLVGVEHAEEEAKKEFEAAWAALRAGGEGEKSSGGGEKVEAGR